MPDKESLIQLCKTLGRKRRVDVLDKLSSGSYRNVDIARTLNIDKTRVSEALAELTDMRLVVKFERDAIIGEKHTLYVATPFGGEVLGISEKLGRLRRSFPGTVLDFGDGIAYILKYYMGIDALEVAHETVMTRKGRKVSLEIMRAPCEKRNCEITCDPIIKNVVRKFGEIDKYERELEGEKCRFGVTFWYKERGG
jgi:DNA-binding HxlR family transcriptional regulator